MNTLDFVAQRASHAIHESVIDLPARTPPSDDPVAARAAVRRVGYAAVALTGAFVVATGLVTGPMTADPISRLQVPTTTHPAVTVTTTVPPSPSDADALLVPPVPVPDVPSAAPADTSAPSLTVTSPSSGDHVLESVLTFTGTTEVGSTVIASGKFEAEVDTIGAWTIDLVLSPGPNGVVITATDAAGNVAEVRMVVHLDAPDRGDDGSPVSNREFTAHQKYGSSHDRNPYDVFTGTGAPGNVVTVSSRNGGGTATIDDDGTWKLKVEFHDARRGDRFSVKVRDDDGHEERFTFVSW